MMAETAEIVHKDLDFLPLKTYTNIEEGNALQIDWHSVAPNVNFIFGNPPFVGARLMNPEQKADLNRIFKGWKNVGKLDYVSCWYKKAADFIKDTKIRAALVSTNSICQCDSVAILWKPLFANGVHIDFAHRTFRWDSESNSKVHVHCVIVGFSSTIFYSKSALSSVIFLPLSSNASVKSKIVLFLFLPLCAMNGFSL